MKNTRWIHILMAAALVLIGGAVLAMAETFELEVDDGEVVTIDADGRVQEIKLDDLYDGEVRTIDAGEHQVTVRRDGDSLKVELDGQAVGGELMNLQEAHRVLVMTDGHPGDHDEKVIVLNSAHHPDSETHDIRVEVMGDEDMVWNSEDGRKIVVKTSGAPHPMFFHGAGEDMESTVIYRCEDTGSMLMVDAERATADSYVDPATGCEMLKIDPEHTVVVKKIEIRDEE